MVLRKNQKNFIYFLILLATISIVFTHLYPLSKVKFKIVNILSGPIAFFSSPLFEAKKIFYYHRTFDEYKRLKEQVDILRGRLIGMEELVYENARLKGLLELKSNLLYSSVGANVIGRDPSNWNASLIIDKGKRHGLKQGMAVVSTEGIVGKIAEVDEESSKVILLVDPRFSVAALVQRSRESGLVSGTLQGICRMTYIDPDARIKVGDQVITTKLSSSFPESLSIGEVIQIIDDAQSGTIVCLVQPAVQLSQLSEVLVIIN